MLKQIFQTLRDGATGAGIVASRARSIAWGAGAVAVISMLSSGQSPGQTTSDAGAAPTAVDAVAVIDGEAILKADFNAYFQRYLRQKLYHGGAPEEVANLRAAALDDLIVERLLAQEVARRDIAGDVEAVDQEVAALEERYGTSDRWPEVEKSLPALRAHLLEKSKTEVLKAQVEDVAEPDEAQLSAFYEENVPLFTEPAAWRLAVILIGVPPSATSQEWRVAEAKAKDVHAQVLAGTEFDALVRAFSTHGSANNGGDLGLIHSGQLAPEVEAAVEKISAGKVTPPVQVLEGYGLFKLLELKEAQVHPLEAVRKRAGELYLRERKKEQWDGFVDSLKANAQITVYEGGDAADQAGANPPK